MSDIVLSLGIDAGDAATGADAFMQQYARLKAAISDVTSARAASQQAVTQEAAATTTAAGAFEQEAQKRIQLNEMIKNMVIVRGQEQAAIDAAISRTGALNQVGDAAVGINQRFAASVAQLNAELTGGASAASSHADATTRMGSASTNAAAAQQGLSVGTAGVTREIIVLGREIASGDFSRIPGSLLVLTNRMGGLNLGTLGAVAAFGALAAAMAYPVIQGVTTAYNNQITVEQNLASQSLKTSQDLATFLASMGAGSLSDGDPLSQLQAAKAAFDQAVQQSSSSDPTVAANAQGQLTSLAQQYLTASKSYNASGSGYVSDYDYVQQQLQEVEKSTADQASTATQQVTLLQQQLDAATGTQTNTLTIAQAVENLNTLMAQVNATIASSIASAGGGSYSGVVTPNGTSSTGVSYGVTPPPQPNMAAAINAIGQDYTSLLGRTGTQSDFAYYLNEVQNGVSLDQIATQFMNSPEYLAKHSHANGGLASGWSKVGERGEEWMYVPPSSGAMVYPHGTGGPSNDNGTTAVVQTLRAEMASLRQVVAQVGQQHAELLRVANGYAATQAHAADRAASRPR